MKKVFVYAYSQQNFGDDLFVKILCDRYPKVKFYIVNDKKFSRSYKEISNLISIPKFPNFLENMFRNMNCDLHLNDRLSRYISLHCGLIIHIGGSIFIQKGKWKKKLNTYNKRMIKGKPFFIIGCNFGPFQDQEYYNCYQDVFSRSCDVCFRDRYSYNLFSDMNNVRVESDVVFSLSPKENFMRYNRIVISIIDLSFREELKEYENIYIAKILELSKCFSKNNYSVILMGFCKAEGDAKVIDHILSLLDSKERRHVYGYIYSGDMKEALKLIQESKYIVASRFHAMILGWVYGLIVLPLLYSDKSLHVISDVCFKGEYFSVNEIENVCAAKVLDYFENAIPLNISYQKCSSQRQFQMLDQYLN